MEIKHESGNQGQVFRDALAIRRQVFIEEQGVPEDIEIDELDHQSVHYVGYVNGQAVTTARIIEEKEKEYHLQRVATLKDFRGQGYGQELILAIERSIKEHKPSRIWLGAQDTALGFYEKLGYEIFGEGFIDAGLPHHHMQKYL